MKFNVVCAILGMLLVICGIGGLVFDLVRTWVAYSQILIGTVTSNFHTWFVAAKYTEKRISIP